MPLTGLDNILGYAKERASAIPAFNIYNAEILIGVMQAAEELKAPVIIQMYSRLIEGELGLPLGAMIKAVAEESGVPVCFHLDHGSGRNAVYRALRFGCTGVMFDCSTLPLEDNIRETAEICKIAASIGISVEGELGHIGTTAENNYVTEHTRVDEAVRFVAETGVSALAIMVGTAHGRYKQEPQVNILRIKEIYEATGIPLVLHGGSGIPDYQVTAAIEAGIKKVNFGTDVCYSFLDKVFATPRNQVAVDLFMKPAIAAVKDFAMNKIRLLRAEGLYV